MSEGHTLLSHELKKVCFVERYATSLFVPNRGTDEIGGAEIQQYMLAKEFMARGIRASFVLDDDPRIPAAEVDGIELFKSYGSERGVPLLRFVYPRLPLLWRALRKADADLYYIRGARDIGGVVADFCRLKRRVMFHAIAGNADCERGLYGRQGVRAALFLHGLRRATRVLAQTQTQQRMLREHFRIDSTIVRNVMPVPELTQPASPPAVRRALWVGTLRPNKRPDRFLELARAFPDLEFEMIGPQTRHETAYFHKIADEAKALPNLSYVSFVPFAEIGSRFEQADVIVLTSDNEGFPNVLLQAWSYGKPVISTFDPDGLIEERGLGLTASSGNEAAALRELCGNPETARSMGMSGRRYVEQFHSPPAIVDRLLSLAKP